MKFAMDILSASALYNLRGRNAGLYEIPITPATFTPRKHMSPVLDTRRLRGRKKHLSADSLQSRNPQEGACHVGYHDDRHCARLLRALGRLHARLRSALRRRAHAVRLRARGA